MTFNPKDIDSDELLDFVERASKELKRRKDIINAGAERNEQLRKLLSSLVKQNQNILNMYKSQENIPSAAFVALEMHIHSIKSTLEL